VLHRVSAHRSDRFGTLSAVRDPTARIAIDRREVVKTWDDDVTTFINQSMALGSQGTAFTG
jgi:hypothetical protein